MVTTTPRRPRRAIASAAGLADPLHHELELALLVGRGVHGIPVELHHVDGWRRAWDEHRGTIERKAARYLPGVRPWARYVVGELEPPPVYREPPASNQYWRAWIAGTGRYWTRYPEPYQRNETAWLVELGEIDDEELARYRERCRVPPLPNAAGVFRLIGDYPLEATLRGRVDP